MKTIHEQMTTFAKGITTQRIDYLLKCDLQEEAKFLEEFIQLKTSFELITLQKATQFYAITFRESFDLPRFISLFEEDKKFYIL